MSQETARPTPLPGVMSLTPYVGGDAVLEGRSDVVRLASNEGPLGPSPKAIEAAQKAASDLHRYPEGGSVDLRAALAEKFNLPMEQLVCGSGSDELITLLIKAYAGPGDEVLYSAHGFLMYSITATACGATPVSVPEKNLTADIDAILAAVTSKTKIIFIANPNNPTGSAVTLADLKRLHAGIPSNVILAIDAAYAEYAQAPGFGSNSYSDGSELVAGAENVAMLRTFSKIFGLAALRLGWCYASPVIIDVLNRMRGPFNVNAVAQAAGLASLADQEHLEAAQTLNTEVLPWFSDEVRGMGLTVHPSVGNFVLVDFPTETGPGSATAADQHLRQHGILVRRVGAYGLPKSLRITIGTRREMERVVEAFNNLPKA